MSAIAIAVITIAIIALLAGLGLSYASRALPANEEELTEIERADNFGQTMSVRDDCAFISASVQGAASSSSQPTTQK